jgi:hypothetical protein
MTKLKSYSRWRFEPQDYRVVAYKEVTEKQKREAEDLLSRAFTNIETLPISEEPSPTTIPIDIPVVAFEDWKCQSVYIPRSMLQRTPWRSMVKVQPQGAKVIVRPQGEKVTIYRPGIYRPGWKTKVQHRGEVNIILSKDQITDLISRCPNCKHRTKKTDERTKPQKNRTRLEF